MWERGMHAAARAADCAGARMSAWRVHAYGALADLRLEPARVPALRHPRDVLVRVRAASVNPIDVAMIGGYGARVLNALRKLDGAEDVEFPLVPGRDFAGVVERAGPDANLRPGARVWGAVPPHRQGSHAEFVVVRDEWAGPAPVRLSDAEAGGALYAGLTACALLRAAGLGPGGAGRERALLLGLGGVGQAALQLLARRGAHVTVGCAAELAPLAERLGAAAAHDRHAEDYAARLRAGGPYAAVLDCAGLGGGAAARWPGARFVTLSSPLLRETDARGLAAGALCAGGALLADSARLAARGGGEGRGASALPPHVRWAFFEPSARDVEYLRRLAERGQWAVRVERAWGWRRGADAYAHAAAGGARGKLVIDFCDPGDGDGAGAGDGDSTPVAGS